MLVCLCVCVCCGDFRENMPRKYHFTLKTMIITTNINTDISGSEHFDLCLFFGQFFQTQMNCLQPRLIFKFELRRCIYHRRY